MPAAYYTFPRRCAQLPNVEIVGESNETGALLPTLQRLAPDVILLDWALPGLHSLDARQALIAARRDLYPCVCLVVLCGSREDNLPARGRRRCLGQQSGAAAPAAGSITRVMAHAARIAAGLPDPPG